MEMENRSQCLLIKIVIDLNGTLEWNLGILAINLKNESVLLIIDR